jgi:hypothetical protein
VCFTSDPERVSLLRILRLHPRRTASVTVLLALAGAVGIGVSAPLGLRVRVSRRAGARQTRHAEALVTRLVDVLAVVKPIKAMGREAAGPDPHGSLSFPLPSRQDILQGS